MVDKLQTIPGCDLGFVEHNCDKTPTIIFIHGALSCPLEASLVVPHLQDYHILIPAIHTNVKAPEPKSPFSLQGICTQLAALIETKAQNRQAHVYGHSMGGHLALNLAIQYPAQVSTVIASGVHLFSHWSWLSRSALPMILYGEAILPRNLLPEQHSIRLLNYVMRPASNTLAAEWLAQPLEGDWAECKVISAELISSLPRGRLVDIKARALIIAGGAKPADSIGDLKWVVNQIREAGGEASGIAVKDGSHPWTIQLPQLCASVIRAWIEAENQPEEVSTIL